MTLERAITCGFVCQSCLTTKTRAAICRQCSHQYGLTNELSMEMLVRCSLQHYFGKDFVQWKRNMLGGKGCNEAKGIYPDISLVMENKIIYVEVDENEHAHYNEVCELARYSSLFFGSQESIGKKQIVIRFNPHNNKEINIDFLARLKVLIQLLVSLIHEDDNVASPSQASWQVQFLFYTKENVNKLKARTDGKMSFTVKEDINDASMPLSDSVDKLTLQELTSGIQQSVNTDMIEKARQLQSSDLCCKAFSCYKNMDKRKQCSAASQKGKKLCQRHQNQFDLGKQVHFIDDKKNT